MRKIPKTIRQNEAYVSFGIKEKYAISKGSKAIHRK